MRSLVALSIAGLVFAGCASQEPEPEPTPVKAVRAPAPKAKPKPKPKPKPTTVAKKKKKPRSSRSKDFDKADDERIAALLDKLGKDKKRGGSSSTSSERLPPGSVNLESSLKSLSTRELGKRLGENWADIRAALGSGDYSDMGVEALLVTKESLRRYDRDLRTYLFQFGRLKREEMKRIQDSHRRTMQTLERTIRFDERNRIAKGDTIPSQYYAELRGEQNERYRALKKALNATYLPYENEIRDYRRVIGQWSGKLQVALREIEEGQRKAPEVGDEELPDASSMDPPDGDWEDPNAGEGGERNIYERVRPSILKIQVTTKQEQGVGTGFVIDARGYAVTNHHVVKTAKTVRVRTTKKATYDARVIATDTTYDLALLKVEGLPAAHRPLKFVKKPARFGEEIFTIGHPVNLDWTLTVGRVSAYRKKHMQMQTPVNPGNSGGPVMNKKGEVVGVVVGGYRTTQGKSSTPLEGLNLAIRIKHVEAFLKRHLPKLGY